MEGVLALVDARSGFGFVVDLRTARASDTRGGYKQDSCRRKLQVVGSDYDEQAQCSMLNARLLDRDRPYG